MNLKTTLALLALAAVGATLWFLDLPLPVQLGGKAREITLDQGTLGFLDQDLKGEKLTRIEVRSGGQRVVLERAGGVWSLPGGWPTRRPQVEQLVELLTSLRSRFLPIPLKDGDLKEHGLDSAAVVVRVDLGDRAHALAFGEKASGDSHFAKPTYLRLDEKVEIVQLVPNLIATLRQPSEHYQQRRLFPYERVARDADSAERIERLDAKELTVTTQDSTYRLVKTGEDWELTAPIKDRADPDKLRTILTAVSDLWAEQFVTPKKDGEKTDFGLDKPEQTIRVVPPAGKPITLLIGKTARTKTRKVMRPPPPGLPPGMPPEPQAHMVQEEYRYARLENNDQIFEIKADKFTDFFVKADTLRDTRLARFRADDARRVEIVHGDQKVVLVKETKKEEKDRDRWKIEEPIKIDAESSRVTELLDRLSGLSARDKDILDKAEESHGLKKPAAIVTVSLEETTADKSKKQRTIAFTIGRPEKQPADKAKLFVQLAGWDRVNAIEDAKDELLKLLQRRAIAYRGRRVLDFNATDVVKLEIKRPSETYVLEKEKDAWRLTAPVKADADAGKAASLVEDVGRLEAVEFVEEAYKPEDLETKFGLGALALRATVTFSATGNAPHTLLVGKQRDGKNDYYARLESGGEVFVVSKTLHDDLDRESLAYRPLDLWRFESDQIAELRVKRGDEEHRLKREGNAWKIVEPFEAPLPAEQVKTLVEDVARVRAERVAAHSAKDLKDYGLDKPTLVLTLKPEEKKEKPDPAKPERVLLVGKADEKDPKARYAKLADNDAIFVLSAKVVGAVDRGPLDLLDRTILTLERSDLTRIQRDGTGGKLTFQREKGDWRVVEGPAAPFTADLREADALLTAVCPIIAARFAAYGPKADLAKFGLDKPAYLFTITAQSPGKPKPVEHKLAVGKPVEGTPNEFYARLDDGPAVFILPANDGVELVRDSLHYVNRTLLDLKPDRIAAIQRRMGKDALEIVKKDGTWTVIKPTEQRADEQTLQRLADALAGLKADKVAAYRPKDLKTFGLDAPAAVVTLRLTGDDKAERELLIGKEEDAKTGVRFATVKGSDIVGTLPRELSRQLTAAPAAFRDRGIARFADADRVTMERGTRKVVFTQANKQWKMTEPTSADVEQNELEDFVSVVQRLRADEIVAEKPSDLKPYGLEKPEIRWRFQSGGKDVLDLLIGGVEKIEGKDGQRRYAKLASGDTVFLLDPQLSRRVVAEYRGRTLWPPLDAAQIERLTITRGDSSFTLAKTGDTWTLLGKPDAKVNPAAVRETLDALANLKAARYVVDQGADLKLHGLEPPQVALEIVTPTGKRMLHLGRPEGESKNLYARVVDAKRTEVFVLAESDAGRIARTIQGFAQADPKPNP